MNIFILLIIFQLKHFLADYPLQGKYMLGKFKSGKDWIMPLAAHGMVHAVFTFSICFIYSKDLGLSSALSLLDFVLHSTMDRIKASPELLGRFKPLTVETYINSTTLQKRNNTLFWWSLGLDQMVHHLTDILIIYLLMR